MSGEVPEGVRRLAEQREAARKARDFGTADALRDRIREAGFEVTDTPSGPVFEPRQEEGKPARAERPVFDRADDVPSLLDRPPAFDWTIQWVVQGWAEDVARGIDSFRRRHPDADIQHVVVDAADTDPGVWPERVDVIRFAPQAGWAGARNAGLRRVAGKLVVVVDGSVEATGDVLGPLAKALDDPTVGLTGPFGIATSDLREFRESEGPEVDAIEGYLMAFRRELVEQGLAFDEKFKFYRTADIELSFQVKERGLRAVVTPVPVERHEHRMWANTPEEERAKLSKRNFYRFLDRWRGRTDLLFANRQR